MKLHFALCALLGLALAACAADGVRVSPQTRADARAAPMRDRQAILAMLGEYRVDFDFEETVVLKAGYETHPAEHTGARELVVLVSDDADGLSLQHLLVVGQGQVVKHWRQDWHYEARERLEFTADQTWRLRPVPEPLRRGAWTQCVYEVSDAPRYCGTGHWEYRGPVATWTSDRVWRPLPRREYTTRSDYNALQVVNRHTIVPGGWTHEQDNSKVVRDNEAVREELVREFGFNGYERSTDTDFSPAHAYWQATRAYWATVRAQWQARIDANRGVRLLVPVDGMKMIEPLFEQAEAARQGLSVAPADIDAVFARWTAPPP